MEGTINSFRRSVTTQSMNQMIIYPKGVSTREDATKLVGKATDYKTSSGKIIKGKVASAHGNSGAIRSIFETGMPGQAIGTTITIN
ncbi:MAG: ribosomal protein L35AE/L33A [Candidatus Woesearchaeota archaeon]|jgi:ribosomal protein L35AE/L33A